MKRHNKTTNRPAGVPRKTRPPPAVSSSWAAVAPNTTGKTPSPAGKQPLSTVKSPTVQTTQNRENSQTPQHTVQTNKHPWKPRHTVKTTQSCDKLRHNTPHTFTVKKQTRHEQREVHTTTTRRNVITRDNPSTPNVQRSRQRLRAHHNRQVFHTKTEQLLQAALRGNTPTDNWATLPRVYRFRRACQDWTSTPRQILNTLALSRNDPFCGLQDAQEDTDLWGSGVFAKARARVKVNWEEWTTKQVEQSKNPSRAAKLVFRALNNARADGEKVAWDELAVHNYQTPVVYAAGYVDERRIYVGSTTVSLTERTKWRWQGRNGPGRAADMLARKIATRTADFVDKFYAIPLVDISHCVQDRDAVTDIEREWITRLNTVESGLNVALPVNKTIWVTDRPGRWILNERAVRYPTEARTVNEDLLARYTNVPGKLPGEALAQLPANRLRTVQRWLEHHPQANDPVVAEVSTQLKQHRNKQAGKCNTANSRTEAFQLEPPTRSTQKHAAEPEHSRATQEETQNTNATDTLSSEDSQQDSDSDCLESDGYDSGEEQRTTEPKRLRYFLKAPYLSTVTRTRSTPPQLSRDTLS
jgi:hypothetical protein